MHIPDGDVFVHAGDLMTSGYVTEWASRVEWLAQLPHKVKLYIPGNHDFHLMTYPGPALQDLRSAGVTVVGLPGNDHYTSVTLPNGMRLLGLPYVVDLPRWAFNSTEQEIKHHLKKVWTAWDHFDVIVSHSPVRSILDFADNKQRNTGIIAYLDRFHSAVHYDNQPKAWICGHIHERFGKEEHSGTTFYNVCMSDRNHQHVNPPVEIEL
jgi:Icc-related predicted phosphoesterase